MGIINVNLTGYKTDLKPLVAFLANRDTAVVSSNVSDNTLSVSSSLQPLTVNVPVPLEAAFVTNKTVATAVSEDKLQVYVSTLGYDSSLATGSFTTILFVGLQDLLNTASVFKLSISKAVLENAIAADTNAKTVIKILADSVSITDSISEAETEFVTAIMSIADIATYAFAKVLNEAPSVLEQFQLALNSVYAETAAVTDVLVKSSSSVYAENVSSADVLTRTVGFNRSFLDSARGSETIALATTVVFADALSISDSITSMDAFANTSQTAIETPHLAEQTILTVSTNYADTIIILDSLQSQLLKVLSDQISNSELLTFNAGSSFLETVTPVDITTFNTTQVKSEVSNVQDTYTATMVKAVADVSVVSESFVLGVAPLFVEAPHGTDSLSLGLLFNSADTASNRDVYASLLTKPFTDLNLTVDVATLVLNAQSVEVIPARDALALHATKPIADVARASESGTIYMNTYFLEPYVEVAYNSILKHSF